MPKLGGHIQTTRLILPGSTPEDEAWVVVKHKLPLTVVLDIGDIETPLEQGIAALVHLISEWNFTEDGTPTSPTVEITRENILKLDSDDFEFLTKWFQDLKDEKQTGISDEQKKSSSSTSATNTTDINPSQPASLTISTPTVLPDGGVL